VIHLRVKFGKRILMQTGQPLFSFSLPTGSMLLHCNSRDELSQQAMNMALQGCLRLAEKIGLILGFNIKMLTCLQTAPIRFIRNKGNILIFICHFPPLVSLLIKESGEETRAGEVE
jgi:hypothetical protein